MLGRCMVLAWWAQLGVFGLTVASFGVDEMMGMRCVPVMSSNCTMGRVDEDGRWYLFAAMVIQGLLVIIPCCLIGWWRVCRNSGVTSLSSSAGVNEKRGPQRNSVGDGDDGDHGSPWEYGSRVAYPLGRGNLFTAISSTSPKTGGATSAVAGEKHSIVNI